MINSRPITYVYDDDESISYPLTPSDLVYGRRITPTPNSSHHEIVSTYQSLTKRVKHHKNLLQQLTNRWRKEYLTELREHWLNEIKRNDQRSVSKADIVILKNDSTSRCFWKLGKVDDLITRRDGKVRAAVVEVPNSSSRPVFLRRVIQHLIPIEMKSQSPEDVVVN